MGIGANLERDYGWPVTNERRPRKRQPAWPLAEEPEERKLHSDTWLLSIASLGGIITALLLFPPATCLWMGISTALGHGDPTWNDGEGGTATAAGAVTTVLMFLLSAWTLRFVESHSENRFRVAGRVLWLAPTAIVEVLVALAFLS